jgi:hypothetical protein
MIQLKIKDRVITLRDDLTIGTWQKLRSNEKFYQEDKANLLSLYLDVDPDEVKKLPKKNVDFIEGYLRSEFLKMQSPGEVLMNFTFEKQEYGLENDWTNLAWGAWADFEILTAGDIDKNIHHIMAILYRPIVRWKGTSYVLKEYDPKDVLERAELFKELPVKYWWSVTNFFFQAAKLYITDTKNSLTLRMLWMKLKNRLKRMVPKWTLFKVRQDTTLL